MMTSRIRNRRPAFAASLVLIGLWAVPALAANVWIEGEAATVSQPAEFSPRSSMDPAACSPKAAG